MKLTHALVILVFIVLFGITACAKQPIGGQRDENGCLTGAGYSWDADIGACTRSWEITGDLAKAAKIVIAPLSAGPRTVVSVDALNCTGCFDVRMQLIDQEVQTIRLANWTVCDTCPMYTQPAPGWCSDGNIVAGKTNECGCQGPPKCMKACTKEAKICPDGTAVGRDGENNCEFKPCPGQIANPASQFCEAQGGTVRMVENENGTQGICVLKGGAECDEWMYFRGECPLPHVCTEEQKQQIACTLEYNPVCGDDGVTYGNACGACASKKIDSWTQGECPDKTYVKRDLEQCKVIRYMCIKGKMPFSDDFGCGCKPEETTPPDGKLKATDCLPEERNVSCTKEYAPVCGWNDPAKIQCVVYPCAANYGNKCSACANENVISWTEGKCPKVGG
jgi:putative hemolysin